MTAFVVLCLDYFTDSRLLACFALLCAFTVDWLLALVFG